MGAPDKLSREERESMRAEICYQFYKSMGVSRTLTSLHEHVRLMGVRRSLKTIERWSVKYEWQRRLLEENAEEKRRLERSTADQVEKMNQRHAQFAQGVFGMALASLNYFQSVMTKDAQGNKSLETTVNELIQLFKAAQAGERLARGQATNRIEIWMDLAQTVVHEFGLIFLSVNSIPDEDQRKAEYIRLSDEMMKRYFTETTKEVIDSKGAYQIT